MRVFPLLAASIVCILAPALARAAPVSIVAGENFYGDVAQQIGGAEVQVRSILSNPDQDPHLFEASPAVARAISDARIVVYSGIDYDPWMEKLLAAARSPTRRVIDVAALAARKSGDNPHVWYDTETMLAYAAVLTEALVDADPAAGPAFRTRLAEFQRSLQPIEAEIAVLRDRLAGASVTATEPIFGYMLDALGLHSRNRSFQLAVMNNAEPSASDVAGFERDLKTHAVRLLIYNSQASDPTAERMRAIAAAAGVPVIGATETEPPGMRYQAWMRDELDALDRALPR